MLDFQVNGIPRRIRDTSKPGSRTYTVNLGQEAMQSSERVAMSYTYRTLVAVNEHLLQLRVDQPTRGLAIELDYGSTDIEHINVLDFIAGSEPVRISRSSATVPEKVVAVEYDGWAFPRSGVAFVWSMETRVPSSRKG